MNAPKETGLVPSVSVRNLAAVRVQLQAKLEEASRLLVEAEALAEANGLDPIRYCVGEYGRRTEVSLCRGETEELNRYIDAQLWKRLLDESGLKTFMSSKRRGEWANQINDRKVPEFTPENVTSTFAAIHGQREDMVIEGIVEVFRALSWDYKTNNPRKFGKKIILSYFVDSRYGLFGFYNERCSELDDLTRVFCIVNGEPEPDHRNGTLTACTEAQRAGETRLETKYLKLRWYKKGTVHVEFKDPGAVAIMNRMIAKAHPNALPPG